MKTAWDLTLWYKDHNDPQIEKDVRAIERAYGVFDKKYRSSKAYLKNERALFEALTDYEALFASLPLTKPIAYFSYLQTLNSEDQIARAKITQLMERFAKNDHKIVFFELSLATIPATLQKKFLNSKKLSHFNYFLKNIFERSKYNLSEAEEKILGLKALTSRSLWIDSTEKILNKKTVSFEGHDLSLAEASQKISQLEKEQRYALHRELMKVLDTVSETAESEINAVYTDKKITDELRGFKEPFDSTILGYQNDKKSVLALVKTVTDCMSISHEFYQLKAQLLNLPHLEYSDRAVGIGENLKTIPFEESVQILQSVFGSLDPRYKSILDSYLTNGQIDVFPKVGKSSGAFCSGNPNAETFIMLNDTGTLQCLSTFAHEMGHGIHTELSKTQSALYENYSIATAEVASTLFESFVFEKMFETLTDNEKIVALHNRINDDIQTIFRQIACFNFELELHNTIRAKGFASKEEMSALLVKHMSAYLGPVVKMYPHDGLQFVSWSHIRNFFYVYSYAFGQLVSKALYVKYKENPKYIDKINTFMKAGGSMSPEDIFKSVGINVRKPEFWKTGLLSIKKDIEFLRNLAQKAGKLK